ncbi:hypothetical protein Tco_1392491 [Tanacetum coccineum]
MSRCRNWEPLIDRRFFWGGNTEVDKVAWIAWDKALLPRTNGGLGIGSLKPSNQSLLAKWWWRFRNEGTTIWCKVIRSIHGESGGILSPKSHKNLSDTWSKIIKLKDDLSKININLLRIFKKKIDQSMSLNPSIPLLIQPTDNLHNLLMLEISEAKSTCPSTKILHFHTILGLIYLGPGGEPLDLSKNEESTFTQVDVPCLFEGGRGLGGGVTVCAVGWVLVGLVVWMGHMWKCKVCLADRLADVGIAQLCGGVDLELFCGDFGWSSCGVMVVIVGEYKYLGGYGTIARAMVVAVLVESASSTAPQKSLSAVNDIKIDCHSMDRTSRSMLPEIYNGIISPFSDLWRLLLYTCDFLEESSSDGGWRHARLLPNPRFEHRAWVPWFLICLARIKFVRFSPLLELPSIISNLL